MTRKKGVSVGSISLVLVFSVLCLTVFAVLTLSSASVDKGLSDKLAEATSRYYAADSLATEVLAEIGQAVKRGEVPETVDGVEIQTYEEDDKNLISYVCEIDENRAISVKVMREGDSLYIAEWCEIETRDWQPDDGMDVWTGS